MHSDSPPQPGRIGLKNTRLGYGWIAIALHWLVAVLVIGLFGLGLWMVELDYYDSWYRRGPDLHRSMGILLGLLVLVRLIWRTTGITPEHEPGISRLERSASGVVHALLYGLLLVMVVSGYLISTADGRSIDVFGLFAVPATLSGIDGQEDIAGDVHWAAAISLITLAGLHALAALKHHFLDRNRTLRRMLGVR